MVSAALERSCSARDFYSGFYVERNADGQICVKRDTLLDALTKLASGQEGELGIKQVGVKLKKTMIL